MRRRFLGARSQCDPRGRTRARPVGRRVRPSSGLAASGSSATKASCGSEPSEHSPGRFGAAIFRNPSDAERAARRTRWAELLERVEVIDGSGGADRARRRKTANAERSRPRGSAPWDEYPRRGRRRPCRPPSSTRRRATRASRSSGSDSTVSLRSSYADALALLDRIERRAGGGPPRLARHQARAAGRGAAPRPHLVHAQPEGGRGMRRRVAVFLAVAAVAVAIENVIYLRAVLAAQHSRRRRRSSRSRKSSDVAAPGAIGAVCADALRGYLAALPHPERARNSFLTRARGRGARLDRAGGGRRGPAVPWCSRARS